MVPQKNEAYLILGHGYEDPVDYESRDIVPSDTYIITFAECGRSTEIQYAYNLTTLFLDPTKEEWLKNPLDHEKELQSIIGLSLRIYKPSEPYPKLHTDFYTQFLRQGGAVKSGLFKYPLVESTFILQPDKTGPSRIAWNKMNDYDKLYEGSIYPPKQMRGWGHTSYLKDVIEKFGPGVYYYPICRSVGSDISIPELKEFLEENYNVIIPENLKSLAEIFAYYETLPDDVKVNISKSATGKDYIDSLRNMQKVPLIRSKSNLRQTGRARRRKIRRTRRKNFQRNRGYQ